MSGEPYPWVRRNDESARAYDAFKTYMNMGSERSTRRVAEELSKSDNIIRRWSSEHDWVERVRAHDQFVQKAETDGFAEQLASVRSRHMELADLALERLKDNLLRLPPGTDPTIRWTQCFAAVTKVHQQALTLRESNGNEGILEQIMKKLQALGE